MTLFCCNWSLGIHVISRICWSVMVKFGQEVLLGKLASTSVIPCICNEIAAFLLVNGFPYNNLTFVGWFYDGETRVRSDDGQILCIYLMTIYFKFHDLPTYVHFKFCHPLVIVSTQAFKLWHVVLILTSYVIKQVHYSYAWLPTHQWEICMCTRIFLSRKLHILTAIFCSTCDFIKLWT